MARPKEFDPQEALDKAMHLFWDKGYHDTSIRDLVEGTGVNYYGLYGEFDSKRGLLLAALDRYRGTVTAEILREIKRPGPSETSLRRAFDRLLSLLRDSKDQRGCLMCNTAVEVAPYDEEVEEKIQDHMKFLRQAFRAKLQEGQASGEIAKDRNLDSLAEFLTTTVYSVGLLLRAGCGKAYAARHVKSVLEAI